MNDHIMIILIIDIITVKLILTVLSLIYLASTYTFLQVSFTSYYSTIRPLFMTLDDGVSSLKEHTLNFKKSLVCDIFRYVKFRSREY